MRKKLVLLISIITLLICTGCGDKPAGEPKDILEQYYQGQLDGNFEASYNLLSSENKEQISLEEFKDWNNISNQLSKTNSFTTTKEEELTGYNYNGKEYKYAFKFITSFKEYDYITEKDTIYESIKIVVSENKEWKVLSEESYRTKYAYLTDYLGWAYREGKSFDKDVNLAISYFLKAIEIDPDYAATYYDIAYAYSYKEQYDKALEYTIIGITKQTDEIALSDLYNMKGTILQAKSDYEEAKKAYNKSLELNPDNVYAGDNLEILD